MSYLAPVTDKSYRPIVNVHMDKSELLCSIARSEKLIKEVENWRNGEYRAKYEELSQLQGQLEDEIAKEEEYHRKISQKLNQIARLKDRIGESVPDDNGFRIEKK